MNASEQAQILKEEYVVKLNVEPEKLERIKLAFDKTKWGAFNSMSYSGCEGNFSGKIKESDFNIEGEDNQYSMKKAEQFFNNKDLWSIIDDSNVKEILKEYFGRTPKLNKKKLNIFFTKNLTGKHKQIRKQGWHVDDPDKLLKNKNYNFIKIFIPLCDVDDNNGVTHIIKGSRENTPPDFKLSQFQGKRVSDNYIFKYYQHEDDVKLYSKLGNFFLTRNDGFHKGGFCRHGSRLMIIAEYFVD